MEGIAVLAHPNDVAISFDKYIAQRVNVQW